MHDIQKEFNTYLDKLSKEISLYKNESELWDTSGKINNSPGNLALHLCGNLNHYIGATLLNNGYVRERDLEFSQKNIPREVILQKIAGVKEMLEIFFSDLPDSKLKELYPKDYYGEGATNLNVLFILAFHLSYHVGQIDYHRRINNF